MKKRIWAVLLLLGITFAEIKKINIEEGLLPEIKELIELKPVSKEEIRNSIYAGIYGMYAPKEVEDFLSYGADFLFDYNNEIQQLLKLGNGKALISFIEKYDHFTKDRFSDQSFPSPFTEFSMSMSSSPYAMWKSGLNVSWCLDDFEIEDIQCVESWRANREIYTKYIAVSQYMIDRYLVLQQLDQNLELYFLPHSSLSKEGAKLYDDWKALFDIRLLQAFYLLEDGHQEKALKILLSEQKFFEKVLSHRKNVEIDGLGSTTNGVSQLRNLIMFVSLILDQSKYNISLTDPLLVQFILSQSYDFPFQTGVALPINLLKHHILARFYFKDFDNFMNSNKENTFMYAYQPCVFIPNNLKRISYLNASAECLRLFFEPLSKLTPQQTINFYHTLLENTKWNENKSNKVENFKINNINEKDLYSFLSQIENFYIDDFIFTLDNYVLNRQLLFLKYLILLSKVNENNVDSYLSNLGNLSINPYTNKRILWDEAQKVIHTQTNRCIWQEIKVGQKCQRQHKFLIKF